MRTERLSPYKGVYGGVIIKKAWCDQCQMFAFVHSGILQCCDRATAEEPVKWKRESLAVGVRKAPSAIYQKEQLDRQGNRCFYCDFSFNSLVQWKHKLIPLVIHWDHLVPFSYLQSNPDLNFVASCHICNGLKGGLCFQTVEEAHIYIATKRQAIK